MSRRITSYCIIVSLLLAAGLALCGCAHESINGGSPADEGNYIRVGGISSNCTGIHIGTKATTTTYEGISEDPEAENGEDVSWLIEPLKGGFDIVYGNVEENAHMAVLTLNAAYSIDSPTIPDDEELYTFEYKNTEGNVTAGKKARWYDNGKHFFRGTNVPDALYGAGPHDYDNLSRYIAIPPQTSIEATVGEVRIPYKHRLGRLIVYVMIDPEITDKDGERATLKGYSLDSDGLDDPNSTSLFFRNVNVLDHVTDVEGHEFPVPIWTKAHNVVPHFLEEEAKVTYNKTQDVIIVGDGDAASTYSPKPGDEIELFNSVPVYDIIVRPTYEDTKSILYDEMDPTVLPQQNNLDLLLTLSNGLQFSQSYSFDLDANHQTFLFVTIHAERVDFAESNSQTWAEAYYKCHYFGVNNPRYNLSDAGSSWQRAWRIGAASDLVVDGEKYWDPENRGQYVSQAKWIEKLLAAKEGGECHGDYFILDQDITLDLPADFVFTGHLDARCNTVTVSAASNGYLFAGLNGTYTTAQEADMNQTWEANVHWEQYDADYGSGNTGVWVPLSGRRAEIYNTIVAGGSLLKDTPVVKTGYIFNCYDALHPTSNPLDRIDFVYGE